MSRNTNWKRVVTAAASASITALALSACGGNDTATEGSGGGGGNSSEWEGSPQITNGDSQNSVGDGPWRPDDIAIKCAESGGTITATVTVPQTGDEFTTTQPDGGSGYAGGTLTMADGTEVTWTPAADITDEEMRTADGSPFEDESQSGSAILWEENGNFTFPAGSMNAGEADGMLSVNVAGGVICSQDQAAG